MSGKKKTNPLPLGNTLRDLALLRASDCDLSSVLPPQTASMTPSSPDLSGATNEVDESVARSYAFVKETRAAIRLLHRGEVEKQGERLEEMRGRLEDVVSGLEGQEGQ